MCCVYYRPIKILISNWPRTRKVSQLLQAGKIVASDFSHHGHALVTLYVQFLCSDWSIFDSWVHAEYLCSILNLVYFDSWRRQSFVPTCFFTGCTKWNSAAISSLLSFMASLFIEFYWVFGWEIRRWLMSKIRFHMASFSFFTLLDA